MKFTSRFLSLPGDPDGPNVSRQVHRALWSTVRPTPVSAPSLLAWSPETAALLGLERADIERLLPVLAGNADPEGTVPFATNYGGHQFGNWAGQLGDGRAIVLGELNGFELQLKGAGPTPYSRRGDGRAVLRSSLREFLCSEAMHHLGVPTTRALTLVGTGDSVVRDMFYDGHPEEEPGAIVCRVAPTFVRFGNFELCTARDDVELLERLTTFVRHHFFGDCSVQELLLEVARRTATLIAQWQALGFVHGVMNTDNMSIMGLTLDYGPYGWVDDFDPRWTPNTTDATGRRYALGQQPSIGLWNIERLGVALSPLLTSEADIEQALVTYQDTFERHAAAAFSAKLGLDPSPDHSRLVHALFAWFVRTPTDWTLFFRTLATLVDQPAPTSWPTALDVCFYETPPADHREAGLQWLQTWWKSVAHTADTVRQMNAVNPLYVPRNYLAQEAIDAAHEGNLAPLHTLLDVLRHPFETQPGREHYAEKRPDWAKSRPGCSALSCSS